MDLEKIDIKSNLFNYLNDSFKNEGCDKKIDIFNLKLRFFAIAEYEKDKDDKIYKMYLKEPSQDEINQIQNIEKFLLINAQKIIEWAKLLDEENKNLHDDYGSQIPQKRLVVRGLPIAHPPLTEKVRDYCFYMLNSTQSGIYGAERVGFPVIIPSPKESCLLQNFLNLTNLVNKHYVYTKKESLDKNAIIGQIRAELKKIDRLNLFHAVDNDTAVDKTGERFPHLEGMNSNGIKRDYITIYPTQAQPFRNSVTYNVYQKRVSNKQSISKENG